MRMFSLNLSYNQSRLSNLSYNQSWLSNLSYNQSWLSNLSYNKSYNQSRLSKDKKTRLISSAPRRLLPIYLQKSWNRYSVGFRLKSAQSSLQFVVHGNTNSWRLHDESQYIHRRLMEILRLWPPYTDIQFVGFDPLASSLGLVVFSSQSQHSRDWWSNISSLYFILRWTRGEWHTLKSMMASFKKLKSLTLEFVSVGR